jgi:hypothetical protein
MWTGPVTDDHDAGGRRWLRLRETIASDSKFTESPLHTNVGTAKATTGKATSVRDVTIVIVATTVCFLSSLQYPAAAVTSFRSLAKPFALNT